MNRFFSLAIVAIGGSLAFSACSVDAGDTEREVVAERSEAVCNYSGPNPMLVLLANAMAKELGRWELLTDFSKTVGFNSQPILQLKPNPQLCPTGCPKTKALLAFQDSRLDQLFQFADGTKLNSWGYAAALVGGYDDMNQCKQNGSCPYEKHKLTFASTGAGPCSALNQFGAKTPTGATLLAPANLKNALRFAGTPFSNPHLAFASSSTQVSIGTSLEFEAGGPYGCTEYGSAALVGSACSCPGVTAPSTLQPWTPPSGTPATPNVYYCRH